MHVPVRHRSVLLFTMALLFAAAGCSSGGIVWDTGQVKQQGPTDPATGGRLGEWEFYNRDGTVRAKGAYANGVMEGRWTWYYSTGEPEFVCEYANGIRHGAAKKWEIDGVLRQSGNYVSGKKSGPWVFYAKNGTPIVSIRFLEDKPHGECKIFYNRSAAQTAAADAPPPRLKTLCAFQYGALNGKHKTYTSDGKPCTEATFQEGKAIDAKCWDVMGLQGSNEEADKIVKEAVASDRTVLKKIGEITDYNYEAEISQ